MTRSPDIEVDALVERLTHASLPGSIPAYPRTSKTGDPNTEVDITACHISYQPQIGSVLDLRSSSFHV